MLWMCPLTLSLPRAPVDVPARTVCLVASAISLGFAIHINNGLVQPGAILWLSLALAMGFAAFMKPSQKSLLSRHAPRALPWLVAGGLAIQFFLLYLNRSSDGWKSFASGCVYYALLSTAAMLCIAMVVYPIKSRLIFAIILPVFGLMGVWMLGTGPRPKIDVWQAQMAGLDAMRQGIDPWSSTFPDVYKLPDIYAPGTVKNGIVQLGFPYPPLSVLFDLPAYAVFRDYRYSNLAAMMIAAACIAYARPGRMGPLLGALFLFTPRVFLVLANGWTEPMVAMFLAATVFCACRRPGAMPWMLGLFLVSKQYVPLAMLPAMLLLKPKWDWRDAANLLGKAALIGAAVSLPLALWNFRAFLHSTLLVASGAKFRLDALSYFAYSAQLHDWTPPQSLGRVSFLAALVTGVFVLRRGERSAAGFSAGVALVFMMFFCLNKFAFCNYYYFIVATLCTSAAALQGRETILADAEVVAFKDYAIAA